MDTATLPDLASLRDVGGLATTTGGRTRAGRLWRSSAPAFVDAAQAATLVEVFGLRLRVDLRDIDEVQEATSIHLSAIEHKVLLAPVGTAGSTSGADRSDPVALLVTHYLAYLEQSADSVAAVTRALVEPDHLPALVHCTLGKDRTGVLIAVVLSAIGVRDEEIVDDYARTQDQNEALLARLLALPTYARRLNALPAEILEANADVMKRFLVELDARHGGGRRYLQSIGVSEVVLKNLTRLLVED